MSEMVDKVAKAIYEAWNPKGYPGWDSPLLGRRGQKHWYEIARAAITAMREPTATMNQEGNFAALNCAVAERKWVEQIKARTGGVPSWISKEATASWQAMIDEALKP